MKTNSLVSKIAVAAVFVGALFAQTSSANAQQVKGAQQLIQLRAIKTVKDADELKSGDTVTMACSKCKTMWVAKVKQGAKGAELQKAGGKVTQLIGTHQCEGCNSEIVVTGHGKGKEAHIMHSCKACGDDSAFCCATKADSKSTKGMEKKQE